MVQFKSFCNIFVHLFHPPLRLSAQTFLLQTHSQPLQTPEAKPKSRCWAVGVWGACVWVRGVWMEKVFWWYLGGNHDFCYSSYEYRSFCACILGRNEINELNHFADKSLLPSGDTQMVVRYKDAQGRNRIKGGSDLKKSQSYPRKFFGTI